ncbi:MAG: hypothetical protein KF902_12635 [Phycisphaeraceae bacterium]|nr:hypothetical protein [Phycisphaeraceae bacterium]MCW5768070.1 hypothetical protein [Phycisphaeraceae bacterium]
MTGRIQRLGISRNIDFTKQSLEGRLHVVGELETERESVFTYDDAIEIDDVLDQSGRSMLIEGSVARSKMTIDTPGTRLQFETGLYRKAPNGSVASMGGHAMIDPDPNRRVATIRLRMGATRAKRMESFDVPLAEVATSNEYRQLTPEAHLAVFKTELDKHHNLKTDLCFWLHNSIDSTTVRPIVTAEEPSPKQPGTRPREGVGEPKPNGNDSYKPPFLYAIETLDEHGRVLDFKTQLPPQTDHWTGDYIRVQHTFKPLAGAGPPVMLRVRLITEIENLEIPFVFEGLLEGGQTP